MTGYIRDIIQFAEMHAGLVYVLAFAASCLESIAVVGLVVPGSAIIVALGALVPSGAVGFWWLCFWSILGALIGDGVSYWAGYRHRDRLTRLWPFSRHPEVLAAGERYFATHGGKSVFLARFVAPVRGSVPLVAGIAGMAPVPFFAASTFSAFGWAPLHILPGALIGAGLTLTGAMATRLLVLVIVLVIILWIAGKVTILAVRHGVRALAIAERRADGWARQRTGWLAHQVVALLDPAHGEARALALLGFVLVATTWIFFGVMEDVVTGDPLVRADTAIYNMLQGLRSVVADRIMIVITELGDTLVAGSVSLAVLLWLLWRRAWQAAAYWLAAVGGAGVIGIVIKGALHRPRPVPLYTGWDAFSFPSGHATTNAAIYGFLAILLAHDARPRWQALLAAMAALIVTLIGFSRLYLGAHWFSDVIGGIAFGTAWIALLAIVYMKHNPQQLPKFSIATIAIVTFFVVGSIQVTRKMPVDLERYAVHHTEGTMTAVDWWRDGWRKIPSRRVDLIGEWEEPLVLQWAGTLRNLENKLTAAGWRQPAPWSVASALSWLDPVSGSTTLPVLPKLHKGRPEVLTLIHVDASGAHPKDRWVLRVWNAEFQLTTSDGNNQQLWIGVITQQQFDGIFAPFNFGFEKEDISVPWGLVQGALPTSRLETRRDGQVSVQVLLAHDGIDTLTGNGIRNRPLSGLSGPPTLVPDRKRLGSKRLEDVARQQAALDIEGVLDSGMDRQEALG